LAGGAVSGGVAQGDDSCVITVLPDGDVVKGEAPAGDHGWGAESEELGGSQFGCMHDFDSATGDERGGGEMPQENSPEATKVRSCVVTRMRQVSEDTIIR
jgi:hypothetical protein